VHWCLINAQRDVTAFGVRRNPDSDSSVAVGYFARGEIIARDFADGFLTFVHFASSCALLLPNMANNDRVSFSGNQCFCAWDSTERLYQFTIHIKRSGEEADGRGVLKQMAIPGCGGTLSISYNYFAEYLNIFASKDVFKFYLDLNFDGKPGLHSEARMSVVNPNEGKIRPWEKLDSVDKYPNKTQWLKQDGACTHV